MIPLKRWPMFFSPFAHRLIFSFLISKGNVVGAKKKRNLRTNSFFAALPKLPLATLLMAIFYFTQDDPQRRISRTLQISTSKTSQICRTLQHVCSVDIQNRPFTPFGGPGVVVKCDESKFNHKQKVNKS